MLQTGVASLDEVLLFLCCFSVDAGGAKRKDHMQPGVSDRTLYCPIVRL
jgi:hypothetical protein